MTSVRQGRPEAAAAIWNWRQSASPAPPSLGRARRRGTLQAIPGAAVGALLLFYFDAPIVGTAILAIAGTIFGSALLSPTGAYAVVERIFAALATRLGQAMTWILVPLVFYAVIAPFGALFRRGRRDSMQRFFEPEATTYWSLRARGKTASKSRRQQY